MKKFMCLFCGLVLFMVLLLNSDYVSAAKENYETNPRLIISLTSFPERFSNLPKTLETIKNQSLKPDKIILYLSKQECTKGVPKEIENCVEVHYIEDVLNKNLHKIKWNKQCLKSYGKLIPALLEYPDDIIITFDDDEFYDSECIKYLKETYENHSNAIASLRSRNIDFSFIDNQYDEEYFMFEGVGGVLYPPHCFKDEDIFDINLALKEFGTTDDVYFWRCALLNKTKVVNPFGRTRFELLRGDNHSIGARTLWEINGRDNWKINTECVNKVFVLNPELRELFNFPSDGTYEIISALDSDKVLDISGSSKEQGAKVQLWGRNNTGAQKFNIKYHNEGYYTIQAECSGKMIDIPGSSKNWNTALWQYENNNTDAQKWYILPSKKDSFGIVSKCNYLYMDVQHSNIKNGTPIQCFGGNSTNAQKFKFVECCQSYAQEYEDIVIYRLLQSISNFHKLDLGFYVDVGANDPTYDSVTKFFYDRGWSGINIEPLPDKFLSLCSERKRDINLNVALGEKQGTIQLSVCDGLTTCIKKFMRSQKMITVPLRTFTNIVDEYNINQIDFCKIDVEGFEKSVLLGIDFKKVRPVLFCIEATEPCTNIPSWGEWEQILFDAEYDFIGMRGINRYYIDKSYKFSANFNELMKGIENIPKAN